MQFLKEHLSSDNYDWTTDASSPKLPVTPGRRRFDRMNGNHVLYMINIFGNSIEKLTLNNGHKIEELILRHLPVELKSELSVFNWLQGKYLYQWNQQEGRSIV